MKLVIVTCFGLWQHMDTIKAKISIHMNQDIQIDQSEIAIEYISRTSVGGGNMPEDAQNEYKLGIEVKLYDNANCENEITNIVNYEI